LLDFSHIDHAFIINAGPQSPPIATVDSFADHGLLFVAGTSSDLTGTRR
jgi:hypothetical protein